MTQACFSGTMRNYLNGENRILISAADSGHGDNLIRHSYRDLYDFAERIRNHFGEDSYVGLRALYLMRAIEATVLNESHRGYDYHGISIFLPDEVWWTLRYEDGTPYSDYFRHIYRYLDFSQQTSWDDFIVSPYPEGGG